MYPSTHSVNTQNYPTLKYSIMLPTTGRGLGPHGTAAKGPAVAAAPLLLGAAPSAVTSSSSAPFMHAAVLE